MAPFLEFAWGKRPAEELYDLAQGPVPDQEPRRQSRNTRATRKKLRGELMAELEANKDPRLANDAFDRPPYLSTKGR